MAPSFSMTLRMAAFRSCLTAASYTTIPTRIPCVLTVKIRQPSHEFTFGVGMTFVSYSLVLTPMV
jgi:hypothetical protein